MSLAFAVKSANELAQVTTQLAWRQWRAIGGSATSRERVHSIVDPEALILASLFLADREPRIEDILLSWVEANATLLSVQRLKNLQRAYPAEVRSRVEEFARRAKALARHPRWNALSKETGKGSLPHLPEVRRATSVPAENAASLLLRMRMAIGVGVKADILTMSLGCERPLTVREIADNLGYTVVGVRTAVHDLSSAGFIEPVGDKPFSFAAPSQRWRALLGLTSRPHWATWHHWYAFAIDYIAWFDTAGKRELSDYAVDVKAREIIARHDMFFRYAEQTFGAAAIRERVGSYSRVIEELTKWPSRQEERAAAAE